MTRPPDAHCDHCGCALYLGLRGPKWFEHRVTGRRICAGCLETEKLARRRRPGEFVQDIDLADYPGGSCAG